MSGGGGGREGRRKGGKERNMDKDKQTKYFRAELSCDGKRIKESLRNPARILQESSKNPQESQRISRKSKES